MSGDNSNTNDSGKKIRVFFSFIVSLYMFLLGISEAVFVGKYDEYNNECRQIRQWITAAAIFNICIPIFTCFGLIPLFSKKEKRQEVENFLQIGMFIISIWSAVTYFNINESCHEFWTSNAPELWTFIMIHFVMLWLSVASLAIALIGFCAFSASLKMMNDATIKAKPNLNSKPIVNGNNA